MRPVFIGGSLRSGTTVLADLIGCHPEISPIYETDFVINLLKQVFGEGLDAGSPDRIRAVMRQFVERMPRMGGRKKPYERYVHGNSHLQLDPGFVLAETEWLVANLQPDPVGALRTFITTVFDHHAANDGKPSWANKTPANLHFARALRVVFPDLRLIHVFRDGRDVAASSTALTFGPRSVKEAATWWVAAMELADELQRDHPEQLLEVRYEDLLRDPERVMGSVFEALEMDMPPTLVRDWTAATGGLNPSRIGAWEDSFTTTDRAQFLSIAGPTLERRGYSAGVPGLV